MSERSNRINNTDKFTAEKTKRGQKITKAKYTSSSFFCFCFHIDIHIDTDINPDKERFEPCCTPLSATGEAKAFIIRAHIFSCQEKKKRKKKKK